MHFCRNCRRITPGLPRFCPSCGRSYDVKLCPRLHVNPRDAHACAACGSVDLSTPQPPGSGFGRIIFFLVGFALLSLSILFIAFFYQALRSSPNDLLRPMLLGLGLALSWLAFVQLPRGR